MSYVVRVGDREIRVDDLTEAAVMGGAVRPATPAERETPNGEDLRPVGNAAPEEKMR